MHLNPVEITCNKQSTRETEIPPTSTASVLVANWGGEVSPNDPWEGRKKSRQDYCWNLSVTFILVIWAAHASRLSNQMDSPWHHRTPPEVYLQCPFAARGFRQWQENKAQSISGHSWVKGKVSGGCCSTWSDRPLGTSYPWKLFHFRDHRADNGELDHSCNLSAHLTSRMLLLPVRLNFSDFITQLLGLVAFLIAKFKILM